MAGFSELDLTAGLNISEPLYYGIFFFHVTKSILYDIARGGLKIVCDQS